MTHDSLLSARPRTVTLRPRDGISLPRKHATPFNPQKFFSGIDDGKSTLRCQKHQILFTQGDAAQAVFYILEGRIKLTVVSPQGKEAVVAILESGDFVGETCLAGPLVRIATATTLEASTIERIDRAAMNRLLSQEQAFFELFLSYLLTRNLRVQEDLIDQLFNSAEKRLARTLLLLAHCGEEGPPELPIPKLSQETLAEMVGTTRSRISYFMNRFKKLGFIEYNAGLRVRRSLFDVVQAQ